MNPHEEIGIREVYRELRAVSRRLRVVELQLTAHRAEHKGLAKYKAVLYTTMATAVGAAVASLIK